MAILGTLNEEPLLAQALRGEFGDFIFVFDEKNPDLHGRHVSIVQFSGTIASF